MNLEGNDMYIKKLVIVINGAGGVGKDTLCDYAHKRFLTQNISSIDPVKKIAREIGWNGEKTPEARRLLSDLKKIMTTYNDAPTKYLLEKYRQFIHSGNNILFCHIREPEEIDKFKSKIHTSIATLLVERDTGVKTWGNESDDDVTNYSYDFKFDNNASLEKSQAKFAALMHKMLQSVPEIETMDFYSSK